MHRYLESQGLHRSVGTPLKSLSLENVSNPAVMIHNFIFSYCGNALVVKLLMEFNMKHVIQIVFPISIIANLGQVPLFGNGPKITKAQNACSSCH